MGSVNGLAPAAGTACDTSFASLSPLLRCASAARWQPQVLWHILQPHRRPMDLTAWAPRPTCGRTVVQDEQAHDGGVALLHCARQRPPALQARKHAARVSLQTSRPQTSATPQHTGMDGSETQAQPLARPCSHAQLPSTHKGVCNASQKGVALVLPRFLSCNLRTRAAAGWLLPLGV